MARLLTKDEVSQVLNVSTRSVDRLRKSGLLTATKVLSSVRFKPEDVKAFLEGKKEKDNEA